MSIAIPLFICLLGLVLYFVSSARVAEVGRIAFAFGLLASLLALGGRAIHFS